MRSVIFFVVFYVVIPTLMAFLTLKAHIAAQSDPETAAIGLDMTILLVSFYLYGAGSVHFWQTNQFFLQKRFQYP